MLIFRKDQASKQLNCPQNLPCLDWSGHWDSNPESHAPEAWMLAITPCPVKKTIFYSLKLYFREK